MYDPLERARLTNIRYYRASLECKVYTQDESDDSFWTAIREYHARPETRSSALPVEITEPAAMEKWYADNGLAACLRDHGNGLLSIIGRNTETVRRVGEPMFLGSDLYATLASWAKLVRDYCISEYSLDRFYMPQDFQRAICGDLVAVTTATGRTEFRRMNATDHKEVSIWLQDNGIGHTRYPGKPSTTAPSRVLTSIRVATSNRRLFITDSGKVGLGPAKMKVSDSVFVLLGGKTPFVLRDAGKDGGSASSQLHALITANRAAHRVIGDCYVHRMMDGEHMPREVSTRDQEVHEWIWGAARFMRSERRHDEDGFLALDKDIWRRRYNREKYLLGDQAECQGEQTVPLEEREFKRPLERVGGRLGVTEYVYLL